jgi:predicted DNA-binding transcriptional regulator AlpA
MPSDDYLNTKQAAERYGLSASWLSKLRLSDSGSPHLKIGRRVLYERSAFEKWLASHRKLQIDPTNQRCSKAETTQ